jgi:thiosulfate dehydrogenase
MKMKSLVLIIASLSLAACEHSTPQSAAPVAKSPAPAGLTSKSESHFSPPPESSIPNDDFGKQITLGRQIFMNPGEYAKVYVGNQLSCESCHLDAGRLAHSAPMWGAYPMYPAYRSKTHQVNTFAERLQGCFNYRLAIRCLWRWKPMPIGCPKASRLVHRYLAAATPNCPSLR